MKLSARASIFTLALLVSTNAYASSAIVTSTVNLRTGPGTQYGTIGAIPNGVGIMVAGCTRGYGWCQVSYGGMTGWAASRYIAIQTGNGYTTNNNFGSTAAAVGIPLIAGIVIGSAIANSGPAWGPGPYRGWGGRPNIYNGCIGRNCQSNWGPPRPHWTDPPAGATIRVIIPISVMVSVTALVMGPACVSAAGGKAQRKTGPPDSLLSGASPDWKRVKGISLPHSFHLNAEIPYWEHGFLKRQTYPGFAQQG